MSETWHGTLEHTADLGIWVEAQDLNQLFRRAALALGEVMFTVPAQGEPAWRDLELSCSDLVELLVRYLNEIIYLFDAEQSLCIAAQVAITLAPDGSASLRARLGLIPFDPEQHQAGDAVKAATYHQAKVEQRGPRWRAEVFLDV